MVGNSTRSLLSQKKTVKTLKHTSKSSKMYVRKLTSTKSVTLELYVKFSVSLAAYLIVRNYKRRLDFVEDSKHS